MVTAILHRLARPKISIARKEQGGREAALFLCVSWIGQPAFPTHRLSGGRNQGESRNVDIEDRSVLVDHPIAPAHRSAGRVERAPGNIVKATSRSDQRSLADHPFAVDFVRRSASIHDSPASRDELHGQVGGILDSHMIGPEPPVQLRIRLLGEIADGNPDPNVARDCDIRKEDGERV